MLRLLSSHLTYAAEGTVAFVAPTATRADDEEQRQQALPLLRTVPVTATALPTDQAPEVNPQAALHVVYDSVRQNGKAFCTHQGGTYSCLIVNPSCYA